MNFAEFAYLDRFPLTLSEVLINLGLALVCGLTIAWVYRFTYRGPSYSVSLVRSLVLLSMISAVVILVIGNNLARAFGLVGAMSIIRFRTAIRDTLDIVFIFFALITGMAAGVGLSMLAIVSTLLISTVAILLSASHFGKATRARYLLQLQHPSGEAFDNQLFSLLKKFSYSYSLTHRQTDPQAGDTHTHIQLHLKSPRQRTKLEEALQSLDGIKYFKLYMDEDDPPEGMG